MSRPKPIHDWIASKAEGLTASELRLAAHLGEHLELWAFESAAQLAGRLGVHRSSIVRLAQKLGLNGFPELQTMARDALLKSFSPSNELSLTRSSNVQAEMVEQIYQRELMNLRRDLRISGSVCSGSNGPGDRRGQARRSFRPALSPIP